MDPSDLYGLPLERFTPERNALAKQLRQEGRREQAAEVAKRRKPSLAAWAVNQLGPHAEARGRRPVQGRGTRCRRPRRTVLAGAGDAASLRKAADAERAALDKLAGKARGLLSSEGHALAQTKLEQVSETLHAAAIDEEARQQVREGCLERELRHVGLGPLGASDAGAPAQGGSTPRKGPATPSVGRPHAKPRRPNSRRAAELAERTLKVGPGSGATSSAAAQARGRRADTRGSTEGRRRRGAPARAGTGGARTSREASAPIPVGTARAPARSRPVPVARLAGRGPQRRPTSAPSPLPGRTTSLRCSRLPRGRRRAVELGTGTAWTSISLLLAERNRALVSYDPDRATGA